MKIFRNITHMIYGSRFYNSRILSVYLRYLNRVKKIHIWVFCYNCTCEFLRPSIWLRSHSISHLKAVRLTGVSSSCWLAMWTYLWIFSELFLYPHSLLEVQGFLCNSYTFLCMFRFFTKYTKIVPAISSWVWILRVIHLLHLLAMFGIS